MDERYLPKVSVIVLNWNGREYIKRCLDSLLKTEYPKHKLEIIVVDNASTDGSQEIVAREYPDVILIRNERNLGFCEGNNVGIRKASGDLIILLNNDTYVSKDWIINILKEAKDPKVGIIGCRLLYPSGNIIQSLGCKEKFLGYWEHVGAGCNIESQSYKSLREVDYVPGAALAIKREVIEKIGLLDPRFYAYVEEVDWCYRARKAGYKVVTSNAVVYHYGSVSWKSFPIKQFYLIYRNKVLFISKNYPRTALLKYFVEYPIRFTAEFLSSFLKGRTVTQRASRFIGYNNVWLILLKKYLFNLFFFYITLIPGLRLVTRFLPEARKNSNDGVKSC